jgi:hypothetical protein
MIMTRSTLLKATRSLLACLPLIVGCMQTAAQMPASDAGRAAFVLGSNYGEGFRIYARYPQLSGEARTFFDDAMRNAAGGAKRLGVQFDATPPYVDPKSSDALGAIARAMSDRARAISVAIDARWGSQVASVFELGYRAIIATETVPYLPANVQVEDIRDLRMLAKRAGVPGAVFEKYAAALLAKDQKAAIFASMTFKREVLAQYEAATPMTADQARRLLNTWLAGVKVSLAAIGRTHGASPDVVERLFREARERASAVDFRIPSLPEAESKKPADMARMLHYLMNEVGEKVVDDVRSRLGERYAAIFELAVKSSIALILYGPETGEGDLTPALISAIERTATTAGLPSEVWRALVQKMRARRPYADVKAEIQRMQGLTEDYFRGIAGG